MDKALDLSKPNTPSNSTVVAGTAESLHRAVSEISEEIARVKEKKGQNEQVGLYATLEELSAEIQSLVQVNKPKLDPEMMIYAQKILRILCGQFSNENALGEVVRYVLTDAPSSIIEAHVNVAIEAVREANTDASAALFRAVLNAALEASRNTGAEEAVTLMIREAKDGVR